jgi:peptide/nickel transport system substrate-binding protein
MLKRTLSFLPLVILLITLLTACGGEATPTAATAPSTPTAGTSTGGAATATISTTSTTGGAATATTGTTGGAGTATTGSGAGAASGYVVIDYPVQTFQRNFNPFNANPLPLTVNGVYEPLMLYTYAQGKLLPWLATDYKWSADNKTLTLTLRDGVKWSDGQPFTAADVAYTFNLLKSTPGLQGPGLQAVAGDKAYVDSVSATDDKTVVFNFKTVYTVGLFDIIQQNIVPEHIWKSISDPVKDTNDNPVGTGPVTQIASFQSQAYEIDKNPNYWQSGKPAVQGLRIKGYANNDQRALALGADQTDWSTNFTPDIENTIMKKNPNLNYWFPLFGTIINLAPNTTKKPYDDPNVRKALSLALNRPQMITVAVSDYTNPADVTGLSEGYATWKPADPSTLGDWTTYNTDKANQMLDAAGLKKGADGKRTLADGTKWQPKITTVNGFTDWIAAAQIAVQNLQAVGVDATLETIDYPVWIDRRSKGDFDIIFSYSSTDPTPYSTYRDSMSARTSAPIGTAAAGNYGRFVSPEADTLLDQFAGTTDPATQKDIALKLQKIFADQAPFIPLWPSPLYFTYSTSRFQGWPTKDNPYAAGTVGAGYITAEELIVMTTITPK